MLSCLTDLYDDLIIVGRITPDLDVIAGAVRDDVVVESQGNDWGHDWGHIFILGVPPQIRVWIEKSKGTNRILCSRNSPLQYADTAGAVV